MAPACEWPAAAGIAGVLAPHSFQCLPGLLCVAGLERRDRVHESVQVARRKIVGGNLDPAASLHLPVATA